MSVATNRKKLLHAYRTDFQQHNLQRFGSLRTRKIAIHSTTLLPKNKDTVNKTRLVCNQARSPWRSILRRVGKVLSFLTLELSHHVRTFNLNRLDEIRSHLCRAYKTFSNLNVTEDSKRTVRVFQFDVKQMFTWLAQSSTTQSLRFALAYITFQPPKNRTGNPSSTSLKPARRMETVLIRTLLSTSFAKQIYGIYRQIDDLLLLILANWNNEQEANEVHKLLQAIRR
eukprot:g55459.t1